MFFPLFDAGEEKPVNFKRMYIPEMRREIQYFFRLLAALFCCHCAAAQVISTDVKGVPDAPADTALAEPPPPPREARFMVRNIVIEGNKKTKPSVILRELFFRPGDSLRLPDLVEKFELARQQLMNTTLFHEVIVALKSFEGYDVDVLIQVKERWYIFPLPYFKPVDRNLNQWLVEQKASFKRVNYGMKLLYNNITGRNDKMQLWLITGYTQQFLLNYHRPYFDKDMKWGYTVSLGMGNNKEVNYQTFNDKQAFFRQDSLLRKFKSASAELIYRHAIRTRHSFRAGYAEEWVADTILKLNPGYFAATGNKIRFPELTYTMTYFDLDYIPYPTKGYGAEITFTKRGFNKQNNLWQLTAKGSANWPAGKNAFFSLNAFATLKLPFDQPYYNRRLLGYGDAFLQGYEYYVVDGVASAYLKTSFTRRLFGFGINIPGTKKLLPQRIPFNIYGRVFTNMGYVYSRADEMNMLPNQMLFSGGFGIDITSVYDFTLKLDWSFNQLGQNGVFFHRKSNF
ncbi:MAG TPA: POTRA domain-containing protein [Chitinophagaceae bacterium]|nr:POTRA domain-containing protein [Chitinophagaceae bacterium]